RRFSSVRGTGKEYHALTTTYQLAELVDHAATHAHRFQVKPQRRSIKQPQHDLLAVHRRIGRTAQVEAPCSDSDTEAAILWNAMFRDVHSRHDLDSRDDDRRELRGERRDFAKGSVE